MVEAGLAMIRAGFMVMGAGFEVVGAGYDVVRGVSRVVTELLKVVRGVFEVMEAGLSLVRGVIEVMEAGLSLVSARMRALAFWLCLQEVEEVQGTGIETVENVVSYRPSLFIVSQQMVCTKCRRQGKPPYQYWSHYSPVRERGFLVPCFH